MFCDMPSTIVEKMIKWYTMLTACWYFTLNSRVFYSVSLATDKRFEKVLHQLDVWHKSNKLDKKLLEVCLQDI